MRVLYDHQAFDMQKHGGVSNCFVQLISNFPKSVEYKIALEECDNIHLRDSALMDVRPMSFPPGRFITNRHFLGQGILYQNFSRLFPSRTSYGRNRLYSIKEIEKGNFDVFHPTFFDTYFLNHLKRKPFVLTIHDMIPERFYSKNNVQIQNKRRLVREAAHIVAVSESTKNDIIELLGVSDEKISVIYHGAPKFDTSKTCKPIIEKKYILYVGDREGYKSFIQMLTALIPVFHEDVNLSLVCTGKDFTKYEMTFFKKHRISDQLIHICPNDNEMRSLYKHALCFIYPSQYEGFGIPILEAYSADCPVLLNSKSCFPEIACDAALYFHLDDNNSDLEGVMRSFLSMTPTEKDKRIEKQKERLSFFSWETSARELYDVYKMVAGC